MHNHDMNHFLQVGKTLRMDCSVGFATKEDGLFFHGLDTFILLSLFIFYFVKCWHLNLTVLHVLFLVFSKLSWIHAFGIIQAFLSIYLLKALKKRWIVLFWQFITDLSRVLTVKEGKKLTLWQFKWFKQTRGEYPKGSLPSLDLIQLKLGLRREENHFRVFDPNQQNSQVTGFTFLFYS